MTRRLTRRPRGACPLAPVGIACLAFGAEAACVLCSALDLDAPTSVVTLGRAGVSDQLADGEGQFWAHLARRHDGGPATRDELQVADARGRYDRYRAAHCPWRAPAPSPVRRAVGRGADRQTPDQARGVTRQALPVDAPF